MERKIDTYLSDISRYFNDSNSSEMSYRSAFQNYLETIFSKDQNYLVQHDQKAEKGNKPDFIISRDGVPLLYIEVKKVGEDLNKIEKSDQATRYFGYTNLIISDYCQFRFYRNGEKYEEEPIILAEINLKAHIFSPHPENAERLERTIKDFVTSQKEPIRKGKHLAKIMGGKAQRIRDNVVVLLESEKATDKEELSKMMNFIKAQLIANFTKEDFSDMYAQTIVYGLFAARYHDPTLGDFSREEARALLPKTNPFLQRFFDHIAGASFPKRLKIIVDELCEVFTHADVKTLMEEYFKRENLFGEVHESPDPVIHFYEDFLLEYNPKKKMEMGVFYTPIPVVRFIIRGIDDILKKEFGIPKGLADSSKIKINVKHETESGKSKTQFREAHRVQLLDVAVGTGTFLNETVLHIHESFKGGNEGRWDAYVESELLPRLHGFELMMASYTIAHLKIAMTLTKTGITEFNRRLGVYLTNTLDAAHHIALQGNLFGVVESIAEESKLASEVKRDHPIMVVMGNPPYSGLSQNKHYKENEAYKVEIGGKERLKEKKNWLDDDYVKFIRFAESMIEKNGEGIIGMITAHGYIDNPTFRGMRWHLRKTFDVIYVLDLHGNSNKKEISPDGTPDGNVFDIKTGVSIIFGIKKHNEGKKELATVYQVDMYGKRSKKFELLAKGNIHNINWCPLPSNADVWKIEGAGKSEYRKGFSVAELFPKNTTGIVTARDGVVVDMSKADLLKRIETFVDGDMSESELRSYLFPGKKDSKYKAGDTRGWKLMRAREKIRNLNHPQIVKQIAYRPFDLRYCYYHPDMVDWGRSELMKNFIVGENVGLLATKGVRDAEYKHVFVTNQISEAIYLSGTTATNAMNFPLYLYAEDGVKVPNLDRKIVERVESVVGKSGPEDIFDYVYAYLHSPVYRTKYSEFLKADFPRIPYPIDKKVFHDLVRLGTKLRAIHLLTDLALEKSVVKFPVKGTDVVQKISFNGNKVFINETQYFDNVSKEVYDFYIGGYQPAQKWLKDRKGRTLTNDDFDHYCKIIASISETIKIMQEIDKVLK